MLTSLSEVKKRLMMCLKDLEQRSSKNWSIEDGTKHERETVGLLEEEVIIGTLTVVEESA